MKQYTITSPAFVGQAVVVYDSQSQLVKIDLTSATLTAKQAHAFKEKCPITENLLAEAFTGTQVTIVSQDYQITFEEFWNTYNQKHNKKRCEVIWDRLAKADQIAAFFGHKLYEKHLQKHQWKSKADPDTYLKNRMWESEWK
jgi:hypothetical protein